MPKLKDLLPNIFSTNKTKELTNNTAGHLEIDAAPVRDQNDRDNDNNNIGAGAVSPLASPTVSTELTNSVVRELSDPNYNSATGVVMERNSSNDLLGVDDATSAINNRMNVSNQQQNIVMQFSNASNLHFGSVYNFNSNIATTTNPASSCATDDFKSGACGVSTPNIDGKRSTTRKTTSIVAMMHSQEEPNHPILATIATHLGEGWKQVMRDLGHSEGQIEQALIDHQMHGGIQEVIYQLLLQWVRGADDNVATLGFITTLLWESNKRDCVQRMKLVWKSGNNRKTSR